MWYVLWHTAQSTESLLFEKKQLADYSIDEFPREAIFCILGSSAVGVILTNGIVSPSTRYLHQSPPGEHQCGLVGGDAVIVFAGQR